MLLNSLSDQGFLFMPFHEFVSEPVHKTIVLRHDVDALPLNSLKFAQIQANAGIRGTYYFRAVPGSWDEAVIREIAAMGHEIGYHYEDVSLAAERLRDLGTKGLRVKENKREEELVKIAIGSFKENLAKLREIVPVKSICMHGSPMSRWDSRLLWKYYDYHDFSITGEPYFDIDFNEVLYLTDTGRRWDGNAVSVRDKAQDAGRRTQGENLFADWKVKPVNSRSVSTDDPATGDRHPAPGTRQPVPLSKTKIPVFRPRTQDPGPRTQNPEPGTQYLTPFPKIHSTSDIIRAAEGNRLPDRIMMTFHPQRWTDKPVPWMKELVWQNFKNAAKFFLVRMRMRDER